MKASDFGRFSLGICVTVALLSGCGGLQPPTGAAGAMQQSAGIAAPASSYRVLHIFGSRHGSEDPAGDLIDVKGTLYGTTGNGGNGGCGLGHCGTLFSVTMTGKLKVLYRFGGGLDGVKPNEGLVNVKGTLYGTTRAGGAHRYGTVFSTTTTGNENVLYSFGSGSDGAYPGAGLINVKGTLYGTTGGGGAECSSSPGCGTVFSVTTTGTEKVLYSFRGGSDGAEPIASLINVNGTLYGETYAGSGSGCDGDFGCGTVFSVTTTGKEKILHRFGKGTDGRNPYDGLTDVKGTLYGITDSGGSGCSSSGGCGTVFSITTRGTERVLHSFGGGSDGSFPEAGLIDVNGTLYGSTYFGGGSGCGGGFGCGTLFSVTTTGKEKVVYSFAGASDGAFPVGSLINVKGTLFGTTYYGGNYGCYQHQGCGTFFAFTP